MTTIKIQLPLIDERACEGCPMLLQPYVRAYCRAFPTRQGPRAIERTVTIDRRWYPRRLPQCIEAEVRDA